MNRLRTRQELAIEPVENRARGGGVVNRKIVLKRNPEGEPKPSDFEWLTLDPYMRGLDASGAKSGS